MQNPQGSGDATLMRARYEAMQAAQVRVDELYVRWAELEAKNS
jgi:hypothetical protein